MMTEAEQKRFPELYEELKKHGGWKKIVCEDETGKSPHHDPRINKLLREFHAKNPEQVNPFTSAFNNPTFIKWFLPLALLLALIILAMVFSGISDS